MAARLELLGEAAEVGDYRRPSENVEDGAPSSFLDSLQNQLYWTLRLLIKRHIFIYTPYEIIYAAEEVVNELHRASSQYRLTSPFDIHSLALASMTLLEATVLPEYANECWDSIKKVEEILDHRAKRAAESGEFGDIFYTPAWDTKIRTFIEWRRTKAQESQFQDSTIGSGVKSGPAAPPVLGPNEQRSLQHLADLAVGAEGQVAAAANASSPPPVIPPTENHLTATSPNLASGAQPQGRMVVDFTLLTREGYLNVFAGLIYHRSR